MRFDTLFLKCALFVLAMPVLAMSIGMTFEVLKSYERAPEYAVLQGIVLLGAYTAVAAYYFVLFQAYKLLVYIDCKKVFTNLSVQALKKIQIGAATISSFFVLLMPLIYMEAEKGDAPGLIIVGLFFAFAPFTISVFSYVLQRIVRGAIDMNIDI